MQPIIGIGFDETRRHRIGIKIKSKIKIKNRKPPPKQSHAPPPDAANLDFQICGRDANLVAVKTIQPGLLEQAVERLKSEFQPEQIWLFGSHAWGTPTEDSDVDLMVIVPSSDERPIRREQRAQKCLGRLAVPADVLVRTRKEVNRYKHLRASLFHQVLNQGRKLYG